MYKKNVRILSTHIIAYFSQAQYVIGVRSECEWYGVWDEYVIGAREL